MLLSLLTKFGTGVEQRLLMENSY